jgi:hypothetical protein
MNAKTLGAASVFALASVLAGPAISAAYGSTAATPSPDPKAQRVLAGVQIKPRAAAECPQSRLCLYTDTDFNGTLIALKSVPRNSCVTSSLPARSLINNTAFAHTFWRESGCKGVDSLTFGSTARVADLGFDSQSVSRF